MRRESLLKSRTFKFSEGTINRLQRIRESWCRKNDPTDSWWHPHYSNTEVLRRLINMENDRLDKEAAAEELAKKPVKKPAKKAATKKGK